MMKLILTLLSSLLMTVAAQANPDTSTQAGVVAPGIKCEGVCEANASSAKILKPNHEQYNKHLPDDDIRAIETSEPGQPAKQSK